MDDLPNVRVRLFHRDEGTWTRLNFFLARYGQVERGVGPTSLPEAGDVPYAEAMVTADDAWNMSIHPAFLETDATEVARLPLAAETVTEHESTGVAFIMRMGQLLESGRAFCLSFNTLSPKPKMPGRDVLFALLDTKVDELPLSLHVRNALKDTHQPPLHHVRDPLVYLGQVVRLDNQTLLKRPGIGVAVVAWVVRYLTVRGLWLGMTEKDMQGWQPPDERAKAGG